KHPKGFVIARTTNESTHLKDKTGDRRFLPVMVHQKKQKTHPVAGMPQDWIDQFWGEAMDFYQKGFKFALQDEEAQTMEAHREAFKYVDEYEDSIEAFLSAEFPSGYFQSDDRFKKRAFFQHYLNTGNFSKDEYGDCRFHGDLQRREFCTIREIALECFDHVTGKGRDTTGSKIKNIMDNHKKWKYVNYPARGYRRISDT
ncbi:MAG: hypothetical protein FWF59_01380, partial [Turicibacter sp.]|nr:hypothetical protein [Turicibacter sp.]